MGHRDVSPVVDVGTTATKVYSVTPGKPVKVRKVWAYNGAASDVTIYFALSDGTRMSPEFKVLAGGDRFLREEELPALTFTTDVHAIASATGARIQIEVEVG